MPVPPIFMTNRSQAVRLPKEYQFSTAEVFIEEGEGRGGESTTRRFAQTWRSAGEIGANDLFIAARARGLGLTLVTNNSALFERVSRLRLGNWTKPPSRNITVPRCDLIGVASAH